MKSVICLVLFAAVAFAREIRLQNNCGYTVWPGLAGNGNSGHPANGGFELESGKDRTVQVPGNWNGRIWPRTECEDGKCVTGDCGGKIECNGSIGVAPATLVELALGSIGNLDFYDVSLVDGFNVPISVGPESELGCEAAQCEKNLNEDCPEGSAIENNGETVACKNTCGQEQPNACDDSIFRKNCPNTFVSAFDNDATYNCADADSVFNVVFCP